LEYVAYLLKFHFPVLFKFLNKLTLKFTELKYKARVRELYTKATLTGSIQTKAAMIRPLQTSDIDSFEDFVNGMPEAHLQFFRPHGFDRISLYSVLASPAYLTYGLFIEQKLCAYAMLKLTPTKSAFIGRLVTQELSSLGIGKYLARYLYWQAGVLGVIPHSTISKENVPSMRSHKSIADFEILKELPNNYLLIRFVVKEAKAPILAL